MDWSDIGKMVGKAAPIVGTLLGGPAGGAVGGLVSQALGAGNDPDEVGEILKSDPAAYERIKRLEQEHERELKAMMLEAETAKLGHVNKTMRAEAASNDGYVRRWRPTFGYLAAISWALQSVAIAWSFVWAPEQAGQVSQAIAALTPMWGFALAVLGISVHKRSQDKQVAAGQQPNGGLIQALTTRLQGGKQTSGKG
ncbi:3TM-type holin [uncultured Alcanivorax sp.]|nr:MAG: hypothetical protein Tp1122MES720101_17 [Prokaryotic dsDNA virus sp.]|tara:strand:- start:18052 stop:18642 length:591 start_codon:yes stop_codon:yes gene_type:complete